MGPAAEEDRLRRAAALDAPLAHPDEIHPWKENIAPGLEARGRDLAHDATI
jgi:hypothetical protein